MNIYRGNSFYINIEITIDDEAIDIEDVDKVEFSLGENIKKIYPSESVTYSNNKFTIHILQEDTFNLDYTFNIQGRVKFTNGNVFASSIIEYNLNNTLSGEII